MTDVEITISAARDLKNVNWKHGDLCAYAVAWIDDGRPPTKVTTRVDASGDTNPSWGQKFTLPVAKEKLEDARLLVEIYHDKAEDPEKAIVGRASLALLEMVDAGGYDEPQDYTLKLKRPSGRPHGKVEIVVRLRERRGAYGAPPPPASSYGGPAAGYYNSESRDWQGSGYPSTPYHAQNYPPLANYPGNYPYSGNPPSGGAPPQPYGSYGGNAPYGTQPYAAAPPQPYGTQPYGAAPPQPYAAAPPQPYGTQPYGAAPSQPYGAPPPDSYYSQQSAPPSQKSSKFGGIGTGLAVGALAGAVGGLALGEIVDHKEDEAAEEQAEEDAERYGQLEAARDDDYGGGGDDYGDDY